MTQFYNLVILTNEENEYAESFVFRNDQSNEGCH